MAKQQILDKNGRPIESNLVGKVSNPGLLSSSYFFSNILGNFLNPDQVGITTYEQMLDWDDTISTAIEFLTLATLSRLGEYTHEDKKIRDFITEQFERVQGSLYFIVEELLYNALWAGFSLSEMIFDYIDNKIQLVDVQSIHPSTVEFILNTEGILKNRVKEVKLYNSLENAPIEKFIHYSHRGRFGNPYGNSRLRQLYPLYYFKKHIFKAWAVTLERYGTPLAVGKVSDPAAEITDENGKTYTQMEYMSRVLNSIKTATAISLVTEGDDKIDDVIKFVQASRPLGTDFESAILYVNKQEYRAMLMPGLVSGNDGGSGSYSLGNVHFDLFLLSLDKLKTDITEILLDQPVRRLITWNFGEQDDYGQFQYRDFSAEDSKILSDVFSSLTNSGYLSPQRYEDLNYVREKAGVPGISKEEFAKQEAERIAKEEEIQKRLDEQRQQNQQAERQNQNQNQNNPKQSVDSSPSDEVKASDSIKLQKFSAKINGINSSFLEV